MGPILREQEFALGGAHARAVEIDGEIRAGGEEGEAPQIEGPVNVLAAVVQEEVLPGVETEHGAAIERSRVGVLGEQDRIVDDEQRKLSGDDLNEAFIVAASNRGPGVDAQVAMGFAVQNDDIGHGGS